MKLHCQVNIVVWNQLTNQPNSGKYVKSTLSIGKEIKTENEYFLLHFSSVNKHGVKYKVKSIKNVFTRCLSEGKSTIQFEQPRHDLLIKCEVIQLKCFMGILKLCLQGKVTGKQLTTLPTAYVTNDLEPSKLIISNRSEYPDKGLPRTLETLKINDIGLCNFRREILLLRHLVILDLSRNEIEKIPHEFGRMPNLRELYLVNNKLGTKANDWKWLFGPQILKSLKLLSLSGNSLCELPTSLWKLKELVTLNIDNNSLKMLPSTLGRLYNLRYLNISKNNLESLPCSLLNLRLQHIDISENDFKQTNTDEFIHQHSFWDTYIGSLTNLAAKIVIKSKVYYAPNVIPYTLVDLLDEALYCVCGNPVLCTTGVTKRNFQLKHASQVVVFDGNLDTVVPFDCCFCSTKCIKIVLN